LVLNDKADYSVNYPLWQLDQTLAVPGDDTTETSNFVENEGEEIPPVTSSFNFSLMERFQLPEVPLALNHWYGASEGGASAAEVGSEDLVNGNIATAIGPQMEHYSVDPAG
jgi:hypothetical protein